MDDTPQRYERWYDKHGKLSVAIKLVLLFPEEIQVVIHKGARLLAEKEFNAKELLNSYKSLGKDKTLGLHKASQKKRFYDKNPIMHESMKYIYLMSEENREFMAEHILNMVDLIKDYLKTCSKLNTDPSTDEMETVTKTYVEGGKVQATRALEVFEQEFIKKIQQQAARTAEKTKQGDENIQDSRLVGKKSDQKPA